MSEDRHTVKVKIGDAEFEAVGSEESVQAQLLAFLTTVAECKNVLSPASRGAGQAQEAGVADAPARDKVEYDLAPVFDENEKGVLFLRTLPESERVGEALLLLLLGAHEVQAKHDVSATELKASAEASGTSVVRVDKALRPYREMIREGGKKSGKRYALKDSGKQKAWELIGEMMN